MAPKVEIVLALVPFAETVIALAVNEPERLTACPVVEVPVMLIASETAVRLPLPLL